MRVKIAGIGKCLPGIDVPGRLVTNDDIIKILLAHGALKPGTDEPWQPGELTSQNIIDLVGIRERRWVSDEPNTSDLALVAAEKAMAQAGIGWDDIGVLAIGSSTPEALWPSTSCITLNKVARKKIATGEWTEFDGKAKLRIPAVDLLAACTSSLYAADLVRKHLLFGETEAQYGLAVGAEVLSRVLDFSDTNADLWGDGAGAIVLKKEDGPSGILCSLMGNDPWFAETTHSVGKDMRVHQAPQHPNIFIKGHEVQRFVLRIIPELAVRTLSLANKDPQRTRPLTLADVDLFVCHQANARIFEFPAKKLGIPVEKFYVNVDRRGNCSSASVLMALCEALEEGRIKKGDLVMLISFGGGLTWGSMLVEW